MIVDFHSHILPGVDHGSKSIEQSVSQIRLMGKYADRVVATSHFYPHVHNLEGFVSNVDAAAAELKAAIADIDAPEICIGAEVLLCDFLDHLDGIEQLCIRGTSCMLLEMPDSDAWSERLIGTVETLMSQGIVVVLAHIDRYIRDYEEDIDRLLSMGAKAQVNASALMSFFSKRRLMPYLHSGAVVAFGSDLHNDDAKAVRRLVGAKKYLGADYDAIMASAAELLTDAKPI